MRTRLEADQSAMGGVAQVEVDEGTGWDSLRAELIGQVRGDGGGPASLRCGRERVTMAPFWAVPRKRRRGGALRTCGAGGDGVLDEEVASADLHGFRRRRSWRTFAGENDETDAGVPAG